jgi:hypothetical protein
MSGLRVLLTNVTLASRTGTELFVRDLALGLRAAGHEPSVYTPDPGAIADELRTAGVPATDDLGALAPPDVIHGQHALPCLIALTRFSDAPAVFVVYDRLQWTDAPPLHPRLRRYVAVDDNCRERLDEAGIPESRVAVIRNAVDLARFEARGSLPERPRRALVFSNYATDDSVLPAVREACAREGIEVDVAGAGAGAPLVRPEEVLGRYDLVFAKARCALEALAVGCAVVLCDLRGVGGLVTPRELDRLRRLNFGMRTLVEPVTADVLQREIRRYDAAAAAEVAARIRREAALPRQVEAFVALYREVLAEPRPAQPIEESRAVAAFLASLFPRWGEWDALWRRSQARREAHDELERAREEVRRESDRAAALLGERDAARVEARLWRVERDRAAAESRALRDSATWRLRGVMERTPLARLGRSLARGLAGGPARPAPTAVMPVIVGVPRSGTTLLRMMLDAHPQLAIPPETGFLAEVARLPEGPGARDAVFRAIRGAEAWADFHLAEQDLRAELDRVPEDTRAEAVRAFYRLYARRFGKPRWGEKTPGYGLQLDRIGALLPEAHFVHVIRDGRDVALSVRGLCFAPGESMEEIARDWCRRIEETRAQAARSPRYLEVRYESLVLDTEATLRLVTAFADLPFDPGQLAYHLRAAERLAEHRERRTADGEVVTHAQRLRQQEGVTRPPDASRVGFWRAAMTTDERSAFESVAGGLLRELGYDVRG